VVSDTFYSKSRIDWLSGFLKRNKEISMRTPEMMSLGRIQGFNETQVNNFFHFAYLKKCMTS